MTQASDPIAAAGLGAGTSDRAIQWPVALLAAATILTGVWLLADQGWRMTALFAIGGSIGLVLYQAAFGFTSAYRRLILDRDTRMVQAQLVMLALATVLFAPVLAEGSAWGRGVVGAVAPVGVPVAVGAFMFGLGMQLGGACGSGTLVTVGGGSPRMVVTLIAFIAGSFWASLDMQWWAQTPRLGSISLGREIGWPNAVLLQLGVLALISMALRRWRAAKPPPSPPATRTPMPLAGRILRGPWSPLVAATALALFNWATLVVSGHPWSITWGFTLWGGKAARAVGWDPSTSWFWSGGFTERALGASVLTDDTSVMNIGLILGALTAAALAGRLRPGWRIGAKPLAAAVIGGVLMGYGARIAFGCNIGAFFSGVASTSLHGWLWIASALAGTWLGVRLRPLFRLAA